MVEKNKVKLLGLFILSLIIVSSMSFVVGADLTNEAADVAETGVSVVRGFFGTILGPLFGETEMLSRVFLALLLGMVVYSVISIMFSDSSKKIQWGITFVITSLALLGIPSSFLEVIRTQYGAMGAAILTIIPFAIILMFSVRTGSLLIARMTWIFYAMYYLAMYAYGLVSTIDGGWLTTESIPYLAAFGVGILVFIFIRAIRNAIFKGEIEGLKEKGHRNVQKRKALLGAEEERLDETATA